MENIAVMLHVVGLPSDVLCRVQHKCVVTVAIIISTRPETPILSSIHSFDNEYFIVYSIYYNQIIYRSEIWSTLDSAIRTRETRCRLGYSKIDFSSPPLWCRFFILDYQKDSSLLHHRNTSANRPIRVLLVGLLVSKEVNIIIKCQIRFTDWWLCGDILAALKWNFTCNAKPQNCQINLENWK